MFEPFYIYLNPLLSGGHSFGGGGLFLFFLFFVLSLLVYPHTALTMVGDYSCPRVLTLIYLHWFKTYVSLVSLPISGKVPTHK